MWPPNNIKNEVQINNGGGNPTSEETPQVIAETPQVNEEVVRVTKKPRKVAAGERGGVSKEGKNITH